MNKKLNNLNEQLSRMKKLMTFEMGDHSHETLSNNLIKEQEEKTGGGVQLYVVGKDGQRDIKIGVKGNEIYAVGIDDSLGKKIGGGDLNTLKSNFKSKDQTYMNGLQYVLSKSPNGIISGELNIPGADVYFQNSGSFTTQGVGFFIEDGKPRMVGFDFAKTNELKSGIIKPIKPGKPDIPPPPKIDPEPFEIKMKFDDPFIFDKTELTPAGAKKLQVEINNAKIKIKERPEILDFYKKYPPTVRAFASRDVDPKQKPKAGGMSECMSQADVAGYNKCLSEKRAQKIASDLQAALGIKFKFEGMGETEKYGGPGSGWTPTNQPTKEKTALNRVVLVTFPTFSGVEYKQGE